MMKIRSTPARVYYAILVIVVSFYVVRAPLFIAGYYRNQIVPGTPVWSYNPIGLVVCAIWLLNCQVTFKPFWIRITALAGILLSIFLARSYLVPGQPIDNFGFVALTYGFFLSTTTFMPLVTWLLCAQSEWIGPKVFRAWNRLGEPPSVTEPS